MPILVHGKMITLLEEMEQSRGGSSWVEKGQIYSVGSKKWHRWSPPGDG